MPGPDPAGDLNAGMRLLVDRQFLEGEKYWEQQWRAERCGAQARILTFERKFVGRLRKLGIPVFAHTVIRSAEAQTAAFVQGNSKARAGESPHNHGCAVDIIHGTRAWDLPEESWIMLGHIGKELVAQYSLGLVWGGDWKKPGEKLGWDPAHWELKNWRSVVGLD